MRAMEMVRPDRANRWAVVLAGGDGTRLRPLTRLLAGDERPKQFCSILGSATLLEQTIRRVSLALPRERTMVVVTQSHEHFYLPLLGGVPSHQVIVQPSNQGTALAILYSLLRLAARAPKALVAFFPSDHYFSDEKKFMSYVESAFEAVEFCPDLVTLLGVTPEGPEVDYGWIEPAEPVLRHSSFALYQVRRFWEKPSLPLAGTLMGSGCLWNSFVMVGRVQSFLQMIHRAAPELYDGFSVIRSHLYTAQEEWGTRALYSHLPATNFSQQVLAACPEDLAVLPVSEVGWSDWGEPHRVLSDLKRMGQDVSWRPMRDPTLRVHHQRNWKISTQA